MCIRDRVQTRKSILTDLSALGMLCTNTVSQSSLALDSVDPEVQAAMGREINTILQETAPLLILSVLTSSGLQDLVSQVDVLQRILSSMPRQRMVSVQLVCRSWHHCIRTINLSRINSIAANLGIQNSNSPLKSPEKPRWGSMDHATVARHTQVGIVVVKATAHTIQASWELDFSNVPIFRNVVSIAGRGCFDEFMRRLNQEFHFLAPIPRVTYLDAEHSIQPLDTERDLAKALFAAVTSHHHNLNVFIAGDVRSSRSSPRNTTAAAAFSDSSDHSSISFRGDAGLVDRQAQAALQRRLDARRGSELSDDSGVEHVRIPKEELLEMLKGNGLSLIHI
eukprot:TRINITY_DN16562_c0_g1_i3.p1 TRINITY_DN16562_c0_g1~~TRINITY_DN16562_c0_g1_i3.p1  ORF type:complete len:337 (+),score=104.81 TRINITY_DN16562_c0_g1_i3:90-1100(+)